MGVGDKSQFTHVLAYRRGLKQDSALNLETQSSSAMPTTSSHSQFTDEQIQEIRTRFNQFRVLVVGRANAGKTTLLRKICNATGDPIVFRPNGEKVRYMVKVYEH